MSHNAEAAVSVAHKKGDVKDMSQQAIGLICYSRDGRTVHTSVGLQSRFWGKIPIFKMVHTSVGVYSPVFGVKSQFSRWYILQ
jgi:hypothetical protein